MDIWEEIEDLAIIFEACHKTLAAMGDETRQHIILEMMRMDYKVHGRRTSRCAPSSPARLSHTTCRL